MSAPWESLLSKARVAFTARFHGEPAVMSWAPGRVELLGNHTDYNGGRHRMELAMTLRRSENLFVGVGSGLLDQFSSLFGRADHALFLDCDTMAHDRLPLGQPAPAIVVCDSQTARRLADGMYDQRRA